MAGESVTGALRVVIVGAGAQGKIVADILLSAGSDGQLRTIGFVDDSPARARSTVLGAPVLGPVASLATIAHDAIVIAIGDNAARARVSLQLEGRGERIVSVRHRFSSIAEDVVVGPGTMISAGAVILPGARIGRGVLINTRASVDHDSSVGDFAHVSAGATVGASVHVGARTLIGLGASVMSGRRVGSDTTVGAGALVHRDLPDGVVAVGVPARLMARER